jgi:DNA-binding transcriptional MerR regulator
MLKIGDFSRLSRVSVGMLRYYDDAGLVKPEKIDQFTGYRYYRESQLPAMWKINTLKEMGFGVAAIREIIKKKLLFPYLYHSSSVLNVSFDLYILVGSW